MKKLMTTVIMAGIILVCISFGSQAMANDWTVEVTPYAWLAGIDADITVGDRTGKVDVGFDDLIDYVDFAGGLLVTADRDRWVGWLQADYMDLDSDNDATRFDVLGTLETKITIVEAAVGYQFDNPFMRNALLEVLIGGRYTEMENTFTRTTGVSHNNDYDLFDPMLVLRPWFPITSKLAFNPTLAIGGGGDSDLIYELQPQLRYNFTEMVSMSVGYRRIYYDVDGDRGGFDGALHGVLMGFGLKF